MSRLLMAGLLSSVAFAAPDVPGGASTADPASAPANPADAGGVFAPASQRDPAEGSSGSRQNNLGVGAADGISPTPTPENLENPVDSPAVADVAAAQDGAGTASGAEAAATVPGTGTVLQDGEPQQGVPTVDGGLSGAQAARALDQNAPAGTATGAPTAPAPGNDGIVPRDAGGSQPAPASAAPAVQPTPVPDVPVEQTQESQDQFNADMVAALERSNDQLVALADFTKQISAKYDTLVQKQAEMQQAHEREIEQLRKEQADQASTFQQKLDTLAKQRVEISGGADQHPVVVGLVDRVERLFRHAGLEG
jgi:hypothetical protein